MIVKVEFKKTGKKYFFDAKDLEVTIGDKVVVETVYGLELGFVASLNCTCPEELVGDLKPIVRIANHKDLETYERNQKEKDSVLAECKKLVIKNNLEMKLLECLYSLDRSKLLIYFEADERVDFRQLVKDMAEVFHVRIELRQIGPRDGAKILGGVGPCGLVMCCYQYIDDFDNVSIKMAKNQNLSLNPQKISGNCGKLLCCIKYENETYLELRKGLPDIGDMVILEEGDAKVLSVDVLKGKFKAKRLNEQGEEVFFQLTLNDIKGIKKKKGNNQNDSVQ